MVYKCFQMHPSMLEWNQSWRSVEIMQMQPETASEWDGLPPMDSRGN